MVWFVRTIHLSMSSLSITYRFPARMYGRVRDQINDLTNFTEERRYSALSGIVSIRGKAGVSIYYLVCRPLVGFIVGLGSCFLISSSKRRSFSSPSFVRSNVFTLPTGCMVSLSLDIPTFNEKGAIEKRSQEPSCNLTSSISVRQPRCMHPNMLASLRSFKRRWLELKGQPFRWPSWFLLMSMGHAALEMLTTLLLLLILWILLATKAN